jgi:hypothetical protein
MDIVGKIKQHPVEAGAIIFIGGFVLLMVFRLISGGGSSSQSSDGSLESAYFAAQSSQAQAGDALQATEIESQAQTAQTLIGANASVANNTTWANAQMQGNVQTTAQTQIGANEAIAVAPYAVQAGLISTLGNVASQPGSTVTSSQSNNGFFGLFGGSSSSSEYVPNPAATGASEVLGELAGNLNSSATSTGNHAAH